MNKNATKPAKAVIYCRVSSDKQMRVGDGLQSQETSCREFAKREGIEVEKVFKEEGVSGSLTSQDRPALRNLLAYLDTHREVSVVLIDDLSRLVRSMDALVEIQSKLFARNVRIISPSQEFGKGADEKLVTNVLASVATHQRDTNIERVVNRMTARMLNGFWVLHPPFGYKYSKDVTGGKVLVRDEPAASFITEALEGFAAGRFETQAEVAHYLTKNNVFPTSRSGAVYPSRIKGLLTRILYTGHLEYPKWGVTLRPGKQPALICMKTFEKIQARLGIKSKAPYRKDLNADFPLRGFLLCHACNAPLTASWTRSRNKGHHPYYHCKTKGCARHGKSLRRDLVQGQFDTLVKQLAPSAAVLTLAEEVVKDMLKHKRSEHANLWQRVQRQIPEVERQINGFLEQILETNNRSIRTSYENRVEQLEKQKIALIEEGNQLGEVDTSLEEALGTVFTFLGNPHQLWESDDLEDKRLLLKLAFAKKLSFDPAAGFGTGLTSLPFKVFGGSGPEGRGLVGPAGLTSLRQPSDIGSETRTRFFEVSQFVSQSRITCVRIIQNWCFC